MSTDASENAAPPAKSKKKLVLVVGALLLLLGGGGAAAWYFMGRGGDAAHQAEEEPPKPPVFLQLETFTVNLQGGEHYLQVDLTLEVADQVQVDAIKLHMPRVRSRLLTLLASKDAEALNTQEGKQALVREILAQVRQPLDAKGKPQEVKDALFTSFVIQ
jgi:flagellar FliL protein